MKKTISLLLALVMLLSLAGCGNKQQTGTATETPATQAPTEAPTQAPTESTQGQLPEIPLTSAWWVNDISEPYAISFYDDGTWAPFDHWGKSLGLYNYTLEGDRLTLIDEAGDTLELIWKEMELVSTETGEVLYRQYQDPGFHPAETEPEEEPELQASDMNGRWYYGGSLLSSLFYEFEDGNFQKISTWDAEPEILEEGEYDTMGLEIYYEGHTLYGVPFLDTGAVGANLMPGRGAAVLFADTGTEVELYVREDQLDSGMEEVYYNLMMIMNAQMRAELDDGTVQILTLTPYCFRIASFTVDAMGGLEEMEDDIFGTWHFSEGPEITLNYEGGGSDTVLIPAQDSGMYLPALETAFYYYDPDMSE